MLTHVFERIFRFLLTVGLTWLLLRFLPHPLTRVTADAYPEAPTGELLAVTLLSVLKAMAVSLPVALLLGVPAGLRRGSWADRLLQTPALLLTGVPAVALAMLWVYSAGKGGGSLSGTPYTLYILTVGMWMARAVRDGVALAADPERGVQPGSAVRFSLGRVLQQTGSILAVAGAIEWALPAAPGLFRLITQAMQPVQMPVVRDALFYIILVAAAAHLAGDLLVNPADRRPAPLAPLSRTWVTLGLLLTVVLVAVGLASYGNPLDQDLTLRLQPPGGGHLLGTDELGRDLLARLAAGTRLSALLALVAAAIAAAAGCLLGLVAMLLGRWGAAALTPRVTLPGLLAPLAAGLLAVSVAGPRSLPLLVTALGLASAPAMAAAARRLFTARGEAVRPAALGALGSLLLVLVQVMLAEITLSYIGLGVQPPLPSLGGLLVHNSKFLFAAPHMLTAAALPLVGLAGLSLLGHALADAAGPEQRG